MRLVVALTALALCGACDKVDDSEESLALSEFPNASLQNGIWESVPWQGAPWTPYPGKARITVMHGLGRMPKSVLVYLSFDESGVGPALAAGELARIDEVTETSVVIKNGNESDYFFRLVLQ